MADRNATMAAAPECKLRQELLAAVAELSALRPEWRLGQLLGILAAAAGRDEASAVWDLDDAEALDAARDLCGKFAGDAACGDAERTANGVSTPKESLPRPKMPAVA